MTRPKKTKIEVNSNEPEDINGSTAIAKAKTDALKIKDSGIKHKLDIAKLQAEILKNNGDVKKAIGNLNQGEVPSDDVMKSVRDMIAKSKKDNETKQD